MLKTTQRDTCCLSSDRARAYATVAICSLALHRASVAAFTSPHMTHQVDHLVTPSLVRGAADEERVLDRPIEGLRVGTKDDQPLEV
jgi:hypothetical protein